MLTFPKTTSAREIQRNYRKIFDRVKKTKEPVVVMRNNKPEVVIVNYKKLEEMEALDSVFRSVEQIKKGEAKLLKGSLVDLWHEAQKG
ncbi:MAG: type II toxin-antitoxin system Phd/YefM family antitoxin [Candidatus Blackburnbacteria bacterium]|nr:type II toxin-antitoxin system Phd/YefM family antitoxin [Candidatus Blackburnbacteria bacterium]